MVAPNWLFRACLYETARHPITDIRQVSDWCLRKGQRMKIRRGAEFRRDRRHLHPTLLLGGADLRPPFLMGLQVTSPFGGPWVGHLRPFLVTDAGMKVMTMPRRQSG